MELLKPSYWPAYVRKNRLRILMYHSISETATDRLAVTPERFAFEMEYLHHGDFNVLSLEEACARIEAGRDLRRTIAITFDDGYRDFLTTAVPILARYRFPATLFAVTGHLSQHLGLPVGPEPLMSPAELQEAASHGVAIGSHTVSHAELTKLAPEDLARELADSYAFVAKLMNGFVPLAYPGGKFSDEVCTAASRAGYSCGVVVGGRWGNGRETDKFRLRREPMLASDSVEWFKKRVGGYYEFHYLAARMRGVSAR